MRNSIVGIVAAVFYSLGTPAFSQDVSVADLKGKGAIVLSDEELRTALTGATLRYENAANRTQMRLNADGSVQGTATPRIGGTENIGIGSFSGTWRVDKGRWCFEGRKGAKYCRQVLKSGDKLYYAGGRRGDDSRVATEFFISK